MSSAAYISFCSQVGSLQVVADMAPSISNLESSMLSHLHGGKGLVFSPCHASTLKQGLWSAAPELHGLRVGKKWFPKAALIKLWHVTNITWRAYENRLGPTSRLLIQLVWDGTQEFALLARPQVMLICCFGTCTLESNPPEENHDAGTRGGE